MSGYDDLGEAADVEDQLVDHGSVTLARSAKKVQAGSQPDAEVDTVAGDRDGDASEEVGFLGSVDIQALLNNEVNAYDSLQLKHDDVGVDSDQIFLIHGDSFLHEILLSPSFQLAHGMTNLHFFKEVEYHLHKLSEGKKQFRFVFFHHATKAWTQLAESKQVQARFHDVLFLRELLIFHLKQHCHVLVDQFNHHTDSKFEKFLQRIDPAFVLVGDGFTVNTSNDSAPPASAADNFKLFHTDYLQHLESSAQSNTATNGTTFTPRADIRSFTLYMLSHTSIRCIRLTELKYSQNSLFGFQLAMPPSLRRVLRERPNPELDAAFDQGPIYRVNHLAMVNTQLITHIETLLASQLHVVNASQSQQYTHKFVTVIYALHHVLQAQENLDQFKEVSKETLCKLFLIHSLFSTIVPLPSRALNWKTNESNTHPRFESFVAQVYQHALPALVKYTHNEAIKQLPSLLDFFDGRLFAFLLHIFTTASFKSNITSLGITKEQESFISALWKLVDSKSNFVPLLSITHLAAADAKLLSSEQVKELKEKAKLPLLQAADGNTLPAVEQLSLQDKSQNNSEPAAAKKPAAAAAPAEDVPASWDEEEEEDEDKKKAADDDVLDSWDQSDDEAVEEKKPEPKSTASSTAAPAASAPSVPAASSSSSSSGNADLGHVVSPIQPIHQTKNDLSDALAGNLDQKLSVFGLVSSSSLSSTSPANSLLLGDGISEKTEVPKTFFEMRHHDRYVAYLNAYSQSLAPGRLILREVLLAKKDDKKEEKEEKEDAAEDSKKGGKGKPGAKKDKDDKKGGKAGGSKKPSASELAREKAARDIAERKKAEFAKKLNARLVLSERLHSTLESKYNYLDKELESMSEPGAVPALFTLLGFAFDLWRENRHNKDYDRAVRVWMHIHDIYRRFREHLTSSTDPKAKAEDRQLQVLLEYLILLGFDSAANMLADDYVNFQREVNDETKMTRESVLPKKPNVLCEVGVSYTRFQLQYCGPYMLRNVDSAPDSRVDGFYPDKWQRDVLDIIDNKQSALIVASTGAGKTFSSYYVIKNVLLENKTIAKQSQRGIVVFISPTKALVSQVVADVYKRYGEVHGVLLEDYSYRPLHCEVLVTTANMFETLLLSPKREEITRRIRWVLADECHTIASTFEGTILERCLAVIRAPFLALSATVGNPQAFHEWLQALERHRGREVHLITHSTRWSDLEKAIYIPENPGQANKSVIKDLQLLKNGKRSTSLHRIHPTAAISDEQELAEAKSFPQELQFTPYDSLSLYDAMNSVAKAEKNSSSSSNSSPRLSDALLDELKSLDPDVFFGTSLAIAKGQAMKYEECIKQALTKWVQHGHISQVSTVMRSLSAELVDKIQTFAQRSRECNVSETDQEYIQTHFFNLLLDLFATDRMPALVFCEDMSLCRKLVEDTVDILEDMQSEFEAKENQSEERKIELKRKEKAREARRRQRDAEKKVSSHDLEEGYAPPEDEEEPEEVEDEVNQRFSFLADSEHMSQGDISYWLDRMLKKTKWKKSHPLVKCIRRGIAIHSPALPKQYNDLVETLFRSKHLKFVLATRQLALGINMPAKCTVFLGDSKFLTPLLYRQMSGRAGRRGYDNVGHCVFFGIPPRKIWRLLKSPLTDLQGHYPLSTSLALRVVSYYTSVLHSNAKACEGVMQAFTPLIQTPFFAQTHPGTKIIQQLQYHFRYTIEHLQNLQLLDALGQTCGHSALAMRIQSHDPANYALIQLLNSGYIDSICQEYDTRNANKVSSALLNCLAYLFNRVVMPAHSTREQFLASLPQTPSALAKANTILLPDMPAEMAEVLKNFNQSSLNVTTGFLRSFSATQLDRADGDNDVHAEAYTQLPVSHLSFPAIFEQTFNAEANTGLSMVQQASLPHHIYARDPFSALSRPVDEFTGVADISASARNGIYIEQSSLPLFDEVDWHGAQLKFNAYVIDFYRTRNLTSLIRQNHLGESFAWAKLKQWSVLLKNIYSALAVLQQNFPHLKGCALKTVETFKYLSANFDEALNKIPF